MIFLSLRRAVWCCLLAIPAGLSAADGVVLIDQASALAGGVTRGDTAGFPVTISEPGSYRLSGNLTVTDPDATAIQITADSVTLDLNGFSIIGPSGCAGPAVTCPAAGKGIGVQAGADRATGPRGVRVRNGTVRGMGTGMMLTGEASFVEKVAVIGNPGGGMSVAGTVLDSSAVQNGSFGIIGDTVRDCTATGNLGDGILLGLGGGTATGNVSSQNGGVGLFVPYGTATGNTMFLNKSFGIWTYCPSAIVGNTVVSPDATAIQTQGAGCALASNATRP